MGQNRAHNLYEALEELKVPEKKEPEKKKHYESRRSGLNLTFEELKTSNLSNKDIRAIWVYFVNESDNDDFSALYKKRKLPAILGSETFLKLIKDNYFIKKKHIEVPESRLLAPEKDKIMAVVCVKYKVSISDLRISIRVLMIATIEPFRDRLNRATL